MQILQDTATSETVQNFLLELRDKLASMHSCIVALTNPFVILDNAPPHKAYATRDEFKRLGFRALSLPPYTPSFNPAEQFFRALKEKVRVDLAQRR